MNPMAKRAFGMLAALVVVIGGIALVKVRQVRAIEARMAASKPPPASVSTTVARVSVWRRQFHAVGTLVAVQGVTVSNQLDGAVERIAFESGQRVKAGDLLVQQDVSSELAQLHGLLAQEDLAAVTLRRAIALRASGTNAQADLDAAKAQYRAAAAAVENERAVIAKKTIRAPFSGLLGIRQVDLGQFLPAGGSIVSLESLDPIYVDFTLPEQDVAELRVGQAVRMTVDAYPGAVFSGAVSALDSLVDPSTRNLRVRATVPNPGGRLVPGMFAQVDVIQPGEDRYLTLPQTAIVYNPYGDAVYVVERTAGQGGAAAPVARQHFVTLGETRGDQVAVLKGIEPGDEVVTAGQLKLRNGSPVEVNNDVAPPDSASPAPPNT